MCCKFFKRSNLLLFLLSLLSLCIGCNERTSRHGKTYSNEDDKERIVVMNVSSDLVWTGSRPPGNSTDLVKVMECTIEGTEEILYLSKNAIEGFEYVEGFRYKIRVRIVELDNPPADGYTERYELLEVVLKEKIS